MSPPGRVSARVEGVVQGVGFRPYVHRLAGELGLAGFVLNDERGVLIEVEGEADSLRRFEERLADHVVVTRSEHIPRIQEAQASAWHVLRELLEEPR